MVTALSVLIADYELDRRIHWRQLLDHIAELDLVGEARNGQEAVNLSLELEPDVVVLRRRFYDLSCIEVAGLLRGKLPNTVLLANEFEIDFRLAETQMEAGVYDIPLFQDGGTYFMDGLDGEGNLNIRGCDFLLATLKAVKSSLNPQGDADNEAKTSTVESAISELTDLKSILAEVSFRRNIAETMRARFPQREGTESIKLQPKGGSILSNEAGAGKGTSGSEDVAGRTELSQQEAYSSTDSIATAGAIGRRTEKEKGRESGVLRRVARTIWLTFAWAVAGAISWYFLSSWFTPLTPPQVYIVGGAIVGFVASIFAGKDE